MTPSPCTGQWSSPSGLRPKRWRSCSGTICAASGANRRHVPYYQALFAELGFNPESVDSVADLQRLPLLDKATIRAHTEQLKARDARGLKRFNTGGSSGEPLIFYLGNERVSHDVAASAAPPAGGAWTLAIARSWSGVPPLSWAPGPGASAAGQAVSHRAAVGLRDVTGQPAEVRGADPPVPAANAVRLPLVPGAHCTVCRGAGYCPGRARHPGGRLSPPSGCTNTSARQ